ncbi:MAG: SinR family protein [Gammaproteobacteria bacterium HGW-Gammaproteobacteria-12]|nr:MAG: SinR family protein [Gammaproteobacteria bacterium HGW-Gammaproteobacteria-12]
MAVYMIGYDLNTPGKDYTKLIDAIKKAYPNWWHCLDSTWLVNTTSSAQQIRDHLKQFIDGNDKLLVATMGKGAAWTGPFTKPCSDWLLANL